MSRHALCLFACLAATPAVAQEAAPGAPTVVVPAPAPAPAKPRKVCRSLQVSGSLMPARSCHTQQEWADIDGNRMRDLNEAATRLILLNHVQGDVTGSTAGALPRPSNTN